MGIGSSSQVDTSFYKQQAFQVIHVVKNSPAEKASLVPYFDYLLQIPTSIIPYNNSYGTVKDFMLKTRQNREIELHVFNSTNSCVRTVLFRPSIYDGGDDLSGMIVRPTIINDAISEVEHVQDVIVGSPAFNVGLIPIFDYIIASDNGNCRDLHQICKAHNPNLFLRIYVIDVLLKCSRVVDVPGLIKLGERRFGCTLVSGYLHRIPTFKMDFCVEQKAAVPLVGSSAANAILSRDSLPRPSTSSDISEKSLLLHPSSTKNSDLESESSHIQPVNDQNHGQANNLCPNCHCLNNTNKRKTKTKRHSTNSKRNSCGSGLNIPTTSSNGNCCTFVTPLQLPGSCESDGPIPISVSIPKDIVTNVVADLVKYNFEHKLESAKQVNLENHSDKNENSSISRSDSEQQNEQQSATLELAKDLDKILKTMS